MKNQKINTALTLSCLFGVIFASAALQPAVAATLNWTGASSVTPPVWSDTNNWDIHALPAPADTTIFGTVGATNAAGLVNNTISASTSISILDIASPISAITGVSNYTTTLIQPGITLNTSNINIGYLVDTLGQDPSYIYTVLGPGATVSMGNTNVPGAAGGLRVSSQGRTNSLATPVTHFGLLDLSSLDTFNVGMANFWAGWLDAVSTGPNDRPAGAILLAKTNIIVLSGNVADTATAIAPFRIMDAPQANTPLLPSYVEMGQRNEIYTSLMKIGGAHSMANSGQASQMPARMYFRSGLINPTLKLRGTNNLTRIGTLAIGDSLEMTTAGTIQAGGVLDLSGGTVDALIDSLVVGRSATATGTGSAAGNSSGTLTWTAGTFDVNSLSVGLQFADRLNSATGVVNVASGAILRASNVSIGRDAGSLAGTGVGTININGGTVIATNSFAENDLSGGNGSSTVILTNNGVLQLVNPMVASFDDLEYSSGTFSYATNTTVTFGTVNLYPPATAFVGSPGLTLSPGGAGTVGTMNFNNGGLTLNGDALALDLAGTLDHVNVNGALTLSGSNSISVNLLGTVTPGEYPIITYGSLAGGSLANLQLTVPSVIADSRYTLSLDNTAPNINLAVTGTAVPLTWSGGNNANAWDLHTTANWNSGSQEFFQFDQVTFDDSGNASSPVQLFGTLFPQSVTFAANSQHYTLGGSGKITGTVGVTVTGGAKVTLLTSNNDYTGGTAINAGVLEIGDGTTADGALAGNVTNNSELDFNPVFSNNVTAAISGSGTIVKNGPGITRLSGANSGFAGTVTVQQGTLQAGSTTPFGPSYFPTYVTVNSGGTIDLAGNALTNSFLLTGAGAGGNGAFINSAAGSVTVRDVELAGDTTFGGTGGWTVQQSSATGTEFGLLANEFKITKVGTNQVAINGLNSKSVFNLDLGALDIQAGQFTVIGYVTLGSQVNQPITVFTNGILGLRTFFTNVLTKAYVLNDGSVLWGFDGSAAIDGSVTVNGTAVFDANTNVTMLINCPVTGGTLIKGIGFHPNGGASTGVGTLLLAGGANTLSGFQVQSGTVALTNNSTISAPQLVLAGGTLSVLGRTDHTLTLASSQALVGKGTVLGFVSSPAGTSVTPLATNGIITVSSNLTLRGTTTLDLNRSASGVVTNSQIVMGTNATLDCGGSLVLTSSGQPLKYKDTFKLFKAGTILNPFTDASITYPTLGAGLFWTNRIAIDGTVAVAAADPTNRPTLGVAIASGPSLSVNWPTNYATYVLQGQTNSLSVGISTNWATINTTNNQVSLPINTANGSVFLRLLQQ